MTTHRKLTAAVLMLLSVLLLSLSLPCAAWAEKPSGKADRFNVVLAIDKSGSLCCEKDHGTDPDGLRYEALKLFLGLLTESGNNVGTVVFDEQIRYETEPSLLEGMEAKEALIGELAKYYPCDDTDIGKAMLRATEMLRSMKAQNGLPCMIVLFADGMTDFTTGDVRTRFRESWEKADRALTAAKEEGITINGILLNVGDTAGDGRVEMQLYTYETKGAFGEGLPAFLCDHQPHRLYRRTAGGLLRSGGGGNILHSAELRRGRGQRHCRGRGPLRKRG